MAFGRGTVNKVILIGRLGADPELKYTPSGRAVVNFNMATNQVWKDQDGQQQERTDWHRIVAWAKLAEIMGEYLKKGSKAYIEGRLQTRNYDDKDGVKRYITEVVADNMTMLDSKGGGDSSAPSAQPIPEDIPPASDQADDLPF